MFYDSHFMKTPKYVTNHPAVDYYAVGETMGSDYRHYIELRDGWEFTEGRSAGTTSLFFMDKKQLDFASAKRVAKPTPRPLD